ncbi:MAG TPA: alpha/beta hydrolase [Candidatus Acidoferrum sp.]|nr:alpha/beta hydrolase [Candidatus Acidoferrum sp.]
MKLNHFLLLVLITGLAGHAPATQKQSAATMTTQKFEFVSKGNRLSGFVDVPADDAARAMIVIIHGYGKTDVGGRTSYYDLRSRFTQLGISTLIWDKPGCGESQGTFDADQPVESSAREVLDAIRHARKSKLPGSQKIGLWGISRAGWIAPLAITQDSKIAFWISVSGTDDKENFPYLLESNLRIEGRTEAEIKLLLGEWRHGFEITSRGGTFEDYLAATQTLRRDPFMVFLSGGKDADKVAFLAEQKQFVSGTFQVDEATGLMIYVPHFQQMLARVNVPVLAIFGEQDRNVNWRNTAELYSKTIGKNRNASLTIKTFPNSNHNLQQAPTGGLREMLQMSEHRASAGYYEAMADWLRTKVLE